MRSVRSFENKAAASRLKWVAQVSLSAMSGVVGEGKVRFDYPNPSIGGRDRTKSASMVR
jgi:hypothetical protein